MFCKIHQWNYLLCVERYLIPDLTSFSSVHFSLSVVSDSLPPHDSQQARPPCPSPTPRVHSNPCPSSQWCHPTISSSVVPFSSCPQSLLASGSFPMSQLFAWGGQSIGVSASASVLLINLLTCLLLVYLYCLFYPDFVLVSWMFLKIWSVLSRLSNLLAYSFSL